MIKELLVVWALIITTTVHAKTLTSIDIVHATLSAAMKSEGGCLHYQLPTRFCLWFSPWMGRNTTPLLDHYLPDLIVIVYRNAGENPWIEANALFDIPSAAVQSRVIQKIGSGNHSFLDAHEQQVIFKEADVIGNPALAILPKYMGEMLLTSTATPLKPYFQSTLDSALWRGLMPEALLEETASVVLGEIHHIGTGFTDWGSVYPHEGSVIGNNDAKASMVIAARAADLLTNPTSYGHIHQSLDNSGGTHYTAAPITENSNDTLFQLIYPTEKTNCVPLGTNDSYDERMLNEQGVYVWIVWRHYQGCMNGNGAFIGVIP
jgi:integrating conjugative element protein (TIGR03756 family)